MKKIVFEERSFGGEPVRHEFLCDEAHFIDATCTNEIGADGSVQPSRVRPDRYRLNGFIGPVIGAPTHVEVDGSSFEVFNIREAGPGVLTFDVRG